MPRVSIILPFYNSEKYLSEAIESVLSQTFFDFELLLINDGSTDKSLEVAKSFSDSRILIVNNEKNIGLIDSLNKGIDLSKGEFIARMDSDDICLPERILNQVAFMDLNESVILCGTQVEYFGTIQGRSDLFTSDAEMKCSLIYGPCFIHPTVIFRASFIKENNIRYSHTHLHLEDYDLWLRIMHLGNFANLDSVGLKYRLGDQNITQQNKETRELRLKSIFRDILIKLEITPSTKHVNLMYELSHNTSSIENYKLLNQFKKLIIKKNSITHCFDQEALKKVLKQKWSRIFYIASDRGFKHTLKYLLAGGLLSGTKVRYQFSKVFKK